MVSKIDREKEIIGYQNLLAAKNYREISQWIRNKIASIMATFFKLDD
jgi:hypothetical protein